MKNKKSKKEIKQDELVNEEIVDKKEQEETVEIDPVQQQINDLEAKNSSLTTELLKLKADYANYQKRVPRQIEESVGYRIESFAKSLLPGIDNFEHALKTDDSHEIEDVLKGIQIVYDTFLDILKTNKVEQIKSTGEKFDPSQHSAVLQQYDKEKEEGIVLEEYQKGYKLGEKVIRPSMVVVNKLEATTDGDEKDNSEETQNDDTCESEEQK